MTSRSLPLLALLLVASGSAPAALHGIRNEKCADDDASARAEVLLRLASDRKLCTPGMTANQSGGWSCHAGRDCPKRKFRCHTQFVCGARIAPQRSPLPHPTGAATKNRELRDGGVTYIEETVTDEQGRKTTVVRPKTAKDDFLKPTPTEAPPSPTATPTAEASAKPSDLPVAAKADGSTTTPTGVPSGAPSGVAKLKSIVMRGGSTTGAGPGDLVRPIRVPGSLLEAISKCRPARGKIDAPAAQGGPLNAEVHGEVDGKCRLTLAGPGGGVRTCLIPASLREDFAAGGSTLFTTLLMDPSVCAAGGH